MSAYHGHAQFYRGIKEIKPYTKQLSRIDNYLQLDPYKALDDYNTLLKKAKQDKNKTLGSVLDIYKGTIHFYTGQNDSAAVYFDRAMKKAEKLGNKQLYSTASIRRLFVIDRSADSRIMLELMTEEFEDARHNKDTLNMIYALNGMAIYNERMDSTKRSIELYMKAIRLAIDSDMQFEYGILLNNYALLKMVMNSPEDAYKDLQKGIKIAKSLENISLELTLRENLGYYYMEVDSLDRGEEEYLYALKLAESRNFAQPAFHALVNLGALERIKGNIQKSDSLINKALASAHKTKLYYAMPSIFVTMAQIALSSKDYKKMNALLDSATAYAQYSSPSEIQEARYRLKYEEFTSKEDFEEALSYYKKLTKFRDSLDRHGHAQVMKELQLKYDVQKEEKQRVEEKIAYEHKLSKKELDNASLKQKIGIVLVILIIITAGFIIYSFRQKQRKEREFSDAIVNKLEEERGRIARDLHDGLGQGLVILKNKFNLLTLNESKAEQQEQINNNFAEVIEEVRSISRSLIPPELRRLGLKKALQKMIKDIEGSSGIMVTSDLDVFDNLTLDQSHEIRIYRIIQELTNNTMKHSGATSLKIELELIGDTLTIIYQDNGKGFDPGEVTQTDSVGLRSIEQRLRFMRGNIRYDRQAKGFRAILKIKPDKV